MSQTRSLEFEFAIGLDGKLATAHAYLGLMRFFLGRATPQPMSRKRCDTVRAIRSSSNGTFSSGLPTSISDEWFTRSRACANRSK
jgi:hypothetical protein